MQASLLRKEIQRESGEVRAAVARTKQEAEGILRKSTAAVAQLRATFTARRAGVRPVAPSLLSPALALSVAVGED